MEKSAPSERQLRREVFEKDMRWLMGDARGRRLVLKLLGDIGLYKSTYDPALKDAVQLMLFREGQKNIGYRILSEINRICPEDYFVMLKEGQNNG